VFLHRSLHGCRWVLTSVFVLLALSPIVAQEAKLFEVIQSEFVYESAPFPSCHASTIVEAKDGTLIASWFGGTAEKDPDVGIWCSRKIGGAWTVPVELANGVQFDWASAEPKKSVQRFPCWNPVLFQPSRGPLMLFYKVGPSPQTWWGMLMTSEDHGKSWSVPRRLPDGILGPIKNKPIELANGDVLCPTSEENPKTDAWTVHFERTNDLGSTWSRTKPLHDGKTISAIQPSILRLGGERLLAIGRTRQGSVFQVRSDDSGINWGELSLTKLPNPNSGTDALTLQDGRHVLIYNHVTKESVAWGGKRSPLNLAVSSDGENWSPALVLEDERNMEFSYPAIIQSRDGDLHVTYTWKRQRIKYVQLKLAALPGKR
jgi:predicted neuraminidase